MIPLEEMVKPISPEKPCGDDLTYEQAFMDLDGFVKGKPETQFGPAVEPDWKKAKARCLELWKKSKDLRLATTLAAAELESGDVAGFKDCLALANHLFTDHWNDFHPKLNPDDNNDPLERVNIVSAFTASIGTLGDDFKIIQRLRKLSLGESPRLGKITSAEILLSEAGKSAPDGSAPPSEPQIRAVFSETGEDAIRAFVSTLEQAEKVVTQLDTTLATAVGVGSAVSFDVLKKELESIRNHIGKYAPGIVDGISGTTGNGDGSTPGIKAGGGVSGARSQSISGEIGSREDVVRMLDKIISYYNRHEPSSPVPDLLQRAKRLATVKSFFEIITDMAPDAVEQIAKITGRQATPSDGQAVTNS
jgi:type VI secretion system protein ImpA